MMNLKERKQDRQDQIDKTLIGMAPEVTELTIRLSQQLHFKNWSGAADTVRAIKKNPLANAAFKQMMKETKGMKKALKHLGVI